MNYILLGGYSHFNTPTQTVFFPSTEHKEGYKSHVRISPFSKLSPSNDSPYEQLYMEDQYHVSRYLKKQKTGVSIKPEPRGDINWTASNPKHEPREEIKRNDRPVPEPRGDINWTMKEPCDTNETQPSPEKSATASPMK